MNTGIRIVKRDHAVALRCNDKKTGPQTEREISCAVKNWIAELALRKFIEQRVAAEGHPSSVPRTQRRTPLAS